MKLYKVIQSSRIDKQGVVATKNIKKGTFILKYKGKVITNKEAETNPKFQKEDIYMFTLDSKYSLDGDFKSNVARLINHSCNENCEYVDNGSKNTIDVLASKDIKKGEELTADYGFAFSKEDYTDYVCKCGSTNCCGYIIRKGSRWRLYKEEEKEIENNYSRYTSYEYREPKRKKK